jgi:hypothetical protein
MIKAIEQFGEHLKHENNLLTILYKQWSIVDIGQYTCAALVIKATMTTAHVTSGPLTR